MFTQVLASSLFNPGQYIWVILDFVPANANDAIKSAAIAVIGHHDEEGIARFLRERFTFDES